MREIALDIETTGLSHQDGHRIVEIACVEMVNLVRTGNVFHRYVNPERDVPADATRVHGLDAEFLKDFPAFSAMAQDLLDFIGLDASLVIHNAAFDTGFLNAQLTDCGLPTLAQHTIIDTLAMARQQFPGSPASLDALCRRFRVDLSARDKHGALIDTQLLADVYVELRGGRQTPLAFQTHTSPTIQAPQTLRLGKDRPFRAPRPHAPTPEECERHQCFLETIPQSLWLTPSSGTKREESAQRLYESQGLNNLG